MCVRESEEEERQRVRLKGSVRLFGERVGILCGSEFLGPATFSHLGSPRAEHGEVCLALHLADVAAELHGAFAQTSEALQHHPEPVSGLHRGYRLGWWKGVCACVEGAR